MRVRFVSVHDFIREANNQSCVGMTGVKNPLDGTAKITSNRTSLQFPCPPPRVPNTLRQAS